MLAQSPGQKVEERSSPCWFRRGMPGGSSHWTAQAEGQRAGMAGPLTLVVVASLWGFRCVPTVEEAERGTEIAFRHGHCKNIFKKCTSLRSGVS